jgi:hypothetical protein
LLNVTRMTRDLHEGLRAFMITSGWNLLGKKNFKQKL